MQQSGRPQHKLNGSSRKTLLARMVAMTVVAAVCCCGLAQAQSGKLGAYTGTIQVSGIQVSPQTSYSAQVKVSLPVTERDGSSVTAEFLAGEAPNASVLISTWSISHKEKSADSDGKFSSWTCSLAKPEEIQMTPTGVLNVDLKTRKHALSLTLLSTTDIAFNCNHSRSGPFKKKQGVSLYIGTGAPGVHFETQLPFSDPARLSAKYTLLPTAATKEYGPIVQAWEFSLTR